MIALNKNIYCLSGCNKMSYACGCSNSADNHDDDFFCPLCKSVLTKIACSVLVFDNDHEEISGLVTAALIFDKKNRVLFFNKYLDGKIIPIPLSRKDIVLIKMIVGPRSLQLSREGRSVCIDKDKFIEIQQIISSAYKNNMLPKKNRFSEFKGFINLVCKSSIDKIDRYFDEDVNEKIGQELTKKKKPGDIYCKQCDSIMDKTIHSTGNFSGIIIAIIVFIAGLSIFIWFFWTLLGAIIGILLIIMSLGMGGKRQKIWKCRKCGYFFERL